jgi:WD40 repeat protein
MTRAFLSLVVGVLLFGALAWYFELLEIPGVTTPPIPPPAPEVNLGGDLYPPAPFPELQPRGEAKPPPVVLSGYMTIKDKQEVPSPVSGQILFIGEPVPDGAVEAAGASAFLAEPFGFTWMTLGDKKITKFYRRLREGDVVHSEEVVGLIDCSKAIGALEEKQLKILYAEQDAKAAKAAADEAKSRYDRDKITFDKGGLAAAELSASLAAREKFFYDHLVKKEAIKIAENELVQARVYYSLHEIRNKVPYQRCVIQYIYKHRGFAVKEQETIMVVHSLDHLLAEGLIEAQYLDRIKPNMTATLEPTQDVAPVTFRGSHRGEVTAVAFTNDPDAPRVVSAGLDRVVSVRDPSTGALPVSLYHEEPVRALACAPAGAPHNLCISGAGDKIYVWNLDRPTLQAGGLRVKPVQTIPEAHSDAVTCLAFSPDGAYFASGGAEGGIAIWKTADRTLVYRFDPEHGVEQGHSGAITSLAFTPQCRLVSAARDNTVRVWQLKEKGARPDGDPIAGRGGSVSHLGVRSDGKWMAFDQGRTLQLVSLENHGVTVTTMQNRGTSSPFETLALFSPDGSLMLTAGLAEGRMQLWKAPTETARGFEVRQFVSEEKAPVTCAAFAPLSAKGGRHAYAASGSAAGDVYLWPLPTREQVDKHRIEQVPVRLLSQSIDPNTHQARIAVDVPNPASDEYPDGRLIPGRSVTIVIGEE